MTRSNRLYPKGLHTRGEYVWLMDASQPVAALYSTRAREITGLVDWSWAGSAVAPQAGSDSAAMIDTGAGLWVRYGEGPLIDATGLASNRIVYLGSYRADRIAGDVLVCRSPAAYLTPSDEHLTELVVRDDGSTRWREDTGVLADGSQHSTNFGAGLRDAWLDPLDRGARTWSELPSASRWAVGWLQRERPSPGRSRQVRVHCEASTDDLLQLGTGQVISAVRDGNTIWTIVERPTPPGKIGRWLYRVDAVSGETEIALDATAWPDISGRSWPLADRPAESASYEQFWLHLLSAQLLGSVGWRLIDIAVVGRWPDTAIRLRIDHPNWPGRPLVGQMPLYDVVGRISGMRAAAFQLAEYLDSGMRFSWPPQVDGQEAKIWGIGWAAVTIFP